MQTPIESPKNPIFPPACNIAQFRSIGAVNNSGCPRYLFELLLEEPKKKSAVLLASGNVDMTQEQWDTWPAGNDPADDETYQLDSLCENLGLVRITAA